MGQAQSQPAASPVEVRPLPSSHAFPPPPSQRQSTSPPQAFELPPAVAIVPPTNLAASIAETPRSVPAPPPTPAVHAASEMMSGMDRLVTSPLDPSLAASMAGPSHHVPPSTPAVAGMPQLDPPIPVYGGISPPSTPPRTVAPPPVATVAPAPKTMKAWVLRKRGTGAADEAALTLEAAWPVVAPGKGQMRVRVICAALNPVDAKKVTLFGSSATLELPSILGCDGSGVVESLGEEDPLAPFAVAPGDRVYFHNHVVKPTQGTFAEYTICDAGAVCRIADNVSFADAAAVPCAGWTAFVGLFDKLRLQPGSTLLVLGAAGGVGSFAVSLAKLCGCRVIATCSASSTSYVKSLGADVVVDRELPNGKLQDTLKGYAPFDAAFDAVGACSVPGVSTIVASVLRFGSGLCSVLPLTPENEHPFVSNQLSRHYVYLGGHHNDRATQKVLKAVGDSVMQLMSVGVPDPSSVAGAVKRLPSHLSELIQFSQLRQGLLAMESKGTRGKIVMSFAVPAVAKKAPVPS